MAKKNKNIDKEFESWNRKVENMIKEAKSDYEKDEVLALLASRSGKFIKMIVRLLRLNYDPEEIEGYLSISKPKLKTKAIIDTINKFLDILDVSYLDAHGKPLGSRHFLYNMATGIMLNVLETNLFSKYTPIVEKKVYIDIDYSADVKYTERKIFEKFPLKYYIETLLKMQNCIVTYSNQEADVILSLKKTDDDRSISLIDNNYFMDM